MVEINYKSIPFFAVTLLYFALGFVNMAFAYLALLCMGLPFVLSARTGKKIWCSRYCPRADYLSLFRIVKSPFKAPSWLVGRKARTLVLQYFCVNLLFIIMSTFMVSQGRVEPMANVRFLLVFQIPGSLPQLWSSPAMTDWMLHLAYRLYSVMFTSTVLGTVLAIFYKPRTWCAICPVSTVNTAIIKGRS